ncbi:MAG: hypothetical protein M1818_002202 [Claussenomyces sp. TS43310]|nr:MAG: hypothetical protein M1818_002202 [Claussenomyces sp. TS43310]
MSYQKSLVALLALASLVSAGPIVTKRQAYAVTDAEILNYALTLEHLEATFYREGLANYSQAAFVAAGYADPFYANLQEVASDEKTHVDFLTSALGPAAVAECTYLFPSTDPASFVALASVLEGVGVSAYLGAAADIMSADYLTDAASILTIEARHNAYFRQELKESPFPQAFDTPLDFDEVYTLAAPFIVSCPSTNTPLPVKAFPTLTLATTGTINAGTTVTLVAPGLTIVAASGVQIYAAFITLTGPIFVPAEAIDGGESGYSLVIPEGVAGQTYVVLTGCNEFVNDDTIVAGPAIIEICDC